MDVARIRTFGSLFLLITTPLVLFVGCDMPAATSAASKVDKAVDTCGSTAVKNQYLVKWKNGTVTQEFAESADALVRDVIEPNNDQIDFAENDQIIHLKQPVLNELNAASTSATIPDDWGQTRVGADTLWANGVNGQGIIVAVVDTGIDLRHPQLAGQIYQNPNEVINGIDDDRNGYIDDVAGWNFVDNNNKVGDQKGHGTHVAGIIAADHTQGAIKGLAPAAKIMPLEFMDADGNGSIGDAIRAMYYAANNGAKIINASWGGPACSRSLRTAIADLSAKGVLFISAAGNGDDFGRGENIDTTPTYPAAFAVGLQISVGASTYTDRMAGFSNYSLTSVHLLAPGSHILSTFPNNSTEVLDGTSMATPFVAAAAALVWSHRPDATAAQVRAALLSSVDVGKFPVSSGGILNIAKAVAAIE